MMVKQRCGTCRFFQEADLAGSGWCHHPQRKTTSDLMIMVRKNELACRDAWSHSLWQAGQFAEIASPEEASSGDPKGAFVGRPLAPASEEEIAAILHARGGEQPPATVQEPEDVVLSETQASRMAEPDWTTPRDEPAPLREHDTRTAIIKAREAYRERFRLTQVRSADPTDDGGTGTGQTPSDPPTSTVDDAEPLPTTWRARPSSRDGDDGDRGDAVPGSDLFHPGAERNGTPSIGQAIGEEGEAEPRGVDGEATHRHSRPSRVPSSSAESGWITTGTGDLRRERALFGGIGRIAGLRASGPPRRAPDVADEEEQEERVGLRSTRTFGEIGEASDVADDVLVGGRSDDALGEPLDADDSAAAGHDELETAAFGNVRADEVEPALELAPLLHLEPELAPDLPRICRTCRDFRPAEGGERGWCANRWAFSHRRMVAAEDFSPCETSFGSWWLPVDEVWTAAADVSSHGHPTPLLDAILSTHRGTELQRRRS